MTRCILGVPNCQLKSLENQIKVTKKNVSISLSNKRIHHPSMGKLNYFPMQKLEKILPKSSSLVTCPVISPR